MNIKTTTTVQKIAKVFLTHILSSLLVFLFWNSFVVGDTLPHLTFTQSLGIILVCDIIYTALKFLESPNDK